jgi:hypothetical protein
MRLWCTEIRAICPISGEMRVYGGPNIRAITRELAFIYCQENGLGYCKIVGELVAEIPCKDGGYEPDWDNKIDFDIIKNN